MVHRKLCVTTKYGDMCIQQALHTFVHYFQFSISIESLLLRISNASCLGMPEAVFGKRWLSFVPEGIHFWTLEFMLSDRGYDIDVPFIGLLIQCCIVFELWTTKVVQSCHNRLSNLVFVQKVTL